MSDAEGPRSPFAGMPDFSARTPVRVLSLDLIEQMLAEHQLYLETEYHQGHRANFASADLTGRDFSSLNLRGIKMDRAVLKGADFTGTHLQRATLIGAKLQEACFDRADLSGARLSGANLVSASLEDACLAKADMEFALMAKVLLRGACLHEADMSGAQLDGAVLTRADLQKANLRGAGFRDARLDEADLRDARLGGAFPGISAPSGPSCGDQNIVQMYAKNVLLSFAFLPIPSIFVVAPSNLFQCVYCRPIRKFSHGQKDGPPWLKGR
jgi:uncharacterized protein YjbI with pentapeptide repeats